MDELINEKDNIITIPEIYYKATEPPWLISYSRATGDDYCVIISPYRRKAICSIKPGDYKIENARLICGAPLLLKAAQKMLLYYNTGDMGLYREICQVVNIAGGFKGKK